MVAELVAAEFHLPDQVGPVGGVERHPGQRLVHRHQGLAVAADALALAERLGHRLAEGDAAVLGGVVEVDMQVALGLQRDVDQAVAGKLFEHVVEEADPGGHLVGAGAVQVDRRGDPGFLGVSLNGCPAHIVSSRPWSGSFGCRSR
jgi:hypothetical protein